MTPTEILSHTAIALTEDQRRQYFERGFLAIPNAIPMDWLKRLRELSDEFLDASRRFDMSDEVFDLGPNHSSATPHVRRLKALVDRHPEFWAFASRSPLTDIAADLLGPDVKFHSSKLNYKWPGSGEIVKWHQDITAWPHTNYSLVTLGVHLDEVTYDEGPLSCVPGSHEGDSTCIATSKAGGRGPSPRTTLEAQASSAPRTCWAVRERLSPSIAAYCTPRART